MIRVTRSFFFVGIVAALFLLPLSAQVTTGTVTGRVVDSSGGVIPGAHVVLISEDRGTRSSPVNTNGSGDYVIADVTADTYTVEVTAPAFKITRETGIVVTGGDHVGVPLITLQVGASTETVSVTAEVALVQTQSGERSYAILASDIESLPINHSTFSSVVAFAPGVNGTARLGSPQDENNIQLDGVTDMDTGNNGQALQMNIESIGEVKVITQGFQAEYGRASGLQVTAVTKSGTNSLHGAGYGIFTNDAWNSRTWVVQKNGSVPTFTNAKVYGYTIGGPVVIPRFITGKINCTSSMRTSTGRLLVPLAPARSRCACRRNSSATATFPRASTITAS